jgi:hypothetical protein
MSDRPTGCPTALARRYAPILDLCNVVLRPFRVVPLDQGAQPATMIGFRQIEFFDQTALAKDYRSPAHFTSISIRGEEQIHPVIAVGGA